MRIESRGSQAEPAGTQCACAAVSCELSNPVSQLVSSRAENRSYIQFVVICKVGSTFHHTRRGPLPPCCSTPPWQWVVAWPMSCVTPSHGRILNSTGMPAGGSCGSRGPGAGGQASSAVFGVGECGGPGPGRTGAGRLESGLAPPPLLLGWESKKLLTAELWTAVITRLLTGLPSAAISRPHVLTLDSGQHFNITKKGITWPLPGPGPCGDPCPPPGGHRGPAAGPLSTPRLEAHLRPAAARLARPGQPAVDRHTS